jgi:ABC-type dipeptide/oligopeptide/nickel transport system permease component
MWMVPTFVGISFMIWLVMTLAPGEPEKPGSSGDFGADPTAALSNLESANKNVRLYRRQFNLDRPLFWNSWTGLTKEEVAHQVKIAFEGVEKHGPKPFRDARRRLEDWGEYAVPRLVEVLGETSGAHQTFVLRTLRQAAYVHRTVYPAGYTPTAEEQARDAAQDARNASYDRPEFKWRGEDAPQAERDRAVASWRTWVAERREKEGAWSWSGLERVKVGLTDTQFFRYWANLAKGDLGLSSRYQKPVWDVILSRLKYSLSLAVPSFLLAWVLAVFLGVTSAVNHRRALDQGIGVSLFVLYSLPGFVVATILQRKLAVDLGWAPTSGFDSGLEARSLDTWAHFKDVLWHVTLPIVCLTYGSLAYLSRQARSGMLDVLRSDYVRTARAKGLPERQVVWRHAVKNGMLPIITLLGTALPILLAGNVVVELVFNIDGFGLLMLNSIFNKDYNVVMGVELIVAALTLIGMLLTDIFNAALDPRITYS